MGAEIAGRARRARVGMLSQEIYIFAGTMAENIRYGCPSATADEVPPRGARVGTIC